MRTSDRCEGIAALLHLMDENPEAAEGWAGASLSELQVGADCAKTSGRGKATLSIASDASVRAQVEIDRKKGRFLVHPTGYVTITKAFAEKIGLKASDTAVDVRVAERVVSARVAIADRIAVGKSSAERVPVAIVDELPEDIDGLLGLSYLWRFRIVRNERSLVLEPR
jgi:predicted aspartyl protease